MNSMKRIFKNSIFFFLFILVCFGIVSCLGNSINNDSQAVDLGGFKVNSSKLLDSNGNEFVMLGVNTHWTWSKDMEMAQLEAIARSGANTVRIVLSDGSKWNKDDAETVAKLIEKCDSLNMITILEVHDHTGSDEIADLENAAKYFADLKPVLEGKEKTVIVNIANEWHQKAPIEVWRDGYLSAISILRNAGLKHCIMVDAG